MMLYPGHRGTHYRVYKMTDTGSCKTMAVVSSIEAADKLVDKYSEQYPHAYIDYTNSL